MSNKSELMHGDGKYVAETVHTDRRGRVYVPSTVGTKREPLLYRVWCTTVCVVYVMSVKVWLTFKGIF